MFTSRRVRPTRKNRRTLNLETLGDRITPVLGAYDIPAEVLPGGQYDGVAAIAAGTGSLLTTHRHMLTVAHVGTQDNVGSGAKFFLPGKTFTIPAVKRTADPGGDDIAVIELSELGPLHLPGYGLYTGTDEVGKTVTQVGYGWTGTGTSGLLFEDNDDPIPDKVYELKRLRIQGTPTGGTFKLWFADTPNNSVTIAYNASTAFIEQAIELLPGMNDVSVKKVVTAPGHPYNGSYEIVFKDTDYDKQNVPDMFVQDNVSGAIVTLQNLIDGGAGRKKRAIQNVISKAGDFQAGPRLRYDFDNGTNAANAYGDGGGLGAKEGMGAPSDSGSPVFIGTKIAGLHKNPDGDGLDGVSDTRDFGEASVSIRVSAYTDFIEDNLVGKYDLVLDMNHQIWGNDGNADNISVSTVGDQLKISINGAVRYQDNKAFITSVKIIGSGDNETITVGKIGTNVPVTVDGGDGNDNMYVSGVSAGATLVANGGEGDDLFVVGIVEQKLASQIINANIQLYGNGGTDTVRILDKGATDTLPTYTINDQTFSRPFIDPVVYHAEKLELYTRASGPVGVKVQVNASVAETIDIFTGAAGDEIRVGDNSWAAIDMLVNVHGGGGKDTLTVSDSQGTDATTWRVAGNSVFRVGKEGQVTYDAVEQLDLFAGSGSDTIQLFGNPAGTKVYAAGNDGSDTFEIAQGDLDTIGGDLSIVGGDGRNTVVIHDENDTVYGQYTVGSGGVSKTDFAASLFQIDDLTLNVHKTGSTVRIEGTPANLTHVNGGIGNDQFLLSPTAQDLTKLFGGLILDGKGGSDHVRLYDKNSTVPSDEFTVTGNSVVRDNFGDLLYLGMENLTLNLGDGDNKVDLHGTNAGTAVTIKGNGGKDVFNVTQGPKSKVVLDGGDGFDIVKWNTGVDIDDPTSGYGLITKVSIEQTNLPIQF